jgi:hypothetical protein
MTRIRDEARATLLEVVQLVKLIPNVEAHLLADQADAIGGSGTPGSGSRSGHSDPTPEMVAKLAPLAYKERQLLRAIGHVGKVVRDTRQDIDRLLAEIPDQHDAGIRCPGWNAELRARLGGCGKPIEHWTDANGVQHNRSSLLCTSCRRAEERASVQQAE